jgi:hypothetical protein
MVKEVAMDRTQFIEQENALLDKLEKAKEKLAQSLPQDIIGFGSLMEASAERAIHYANICNLENLFQTFKEMGEEAFQFEAPFERLSKKSKLTDKQIDDIYKATGNFDDAVIELIKFHLSQNCGCKNR